jgi:outer membrane lipoprotein-sorting protein
MATQRWVTITPIILLLLLLLTACGGTTTSQTPTSTTPTPSPTSAQAQQLLTTLAQKIKHAKTLHAVLNISISGQTFNGTINTELWNEAPAKNRTLVLRSSLPQFPAGSMTVTNGKQLWQYNPAQKIVYTGLVPSAGTPTPGVSRQNQFFLSLMQSVLTHSKATLVSSSTSIDGRGVYDIHVVSLAQQNATGPNFSYVGEVDIDKVTQLLVRVNLMIQSFGMVTLDVPQLLLDQPITGSLFTFVPPAGVKVLPLQAASSSPTTGTITFVQAQKQAGYHLLSIPGSDTDYELESVTALGAPGNQIFTLNYTKGNLGFTIAEGKSLADLPGGGGQQISLRGTIATLSMLNALSTLAWTEKGVGMRITGNLNNEQIVQIANLLS